MILVARGGLTNSLRNRASNNGIVGCGRWCLAMAILAIGIPSPQRSIAQQPASETPDGPAVARRSAQAIGGSAVLERMTSLVIEASFSIEKSKVQGTVVTEYLAPDSARVTTDLGKAGKTVRIVHASGGWEKSPLGERKLAAGEASRLLDLISMRPALQPEKVYASIRNLGVVDVDGQHCHHLEMTRNGASVPDQVYFDVETGLPVKTITQPDPAIPAVVTSRVSDYKDFDGIKIATKVTQQLPGGKLTSVIRIERVEVNAKLDPSLFAIPQ